MSKSNSKKQVKMKAKIEELVAPLLNRLANGPEEMGEVRNEVEDISALLESRQNSDIALMGFFGNIERQIEYWNENLGENSEEKRRRIVTELRTQLQEYQRMIKEPRNENPQKIRTKYESGEPSNSKTVPQVEDGVTELVQGMNILNQQQTIWLDSLAIFPENAEIKRTLLLHWWIGLGIEPENLLENLAKDFFSYLVGKGILKSLHTRDHNKVIDRCTIHPTIHRQLIDANKEKNRVRSKNAKIEGNWHFYCNDNLRALLNVDQKYLNSEDIITSINDVLEDNNVVQVVQLGRLGCTDLEMTKNNQSKKIVSKATNSQSHIETDEIDFLNKLGEKVTFLSLRGISKIEELPKSILKLQDLRILDLRACHNLQNLPQKPQSKFLVWKSRQEKCFNNLTHLDTSECYLLHHMPRWVCELSNLVVLKGFSVGGGGKKKQFCRLHDLSKLKNLRKLGIRFTKQLDLEDASGLESLNWLSILTITWGAIYELINNNSSQVQTILLPKNLEKLDIRCYPEAEAAELLNPTVLPKLKRLYIRGGNLAKITNDSGWNVEILRIRYLHNFEIDGYELTNMFTKLEFVEYKQCRSLKNFPGCGSAWNIKKEGPFPRAGHYTLGGVLDLEVTNHSRAPLAENRQKILLLLTAGCDSTIERPSLSLVVILEINKSMEEDKLKKVKTAMLFVIKRLSFRDHLAIVTSSAEPRMLWPLKEITESSQMELEDLVNNLEADAPEASNLEKCLSLGLDILKDFRSQDHVVAIMLLSSCGETSDMKDLKLKSYDPSFGNVAVHTFGFGEHYDLMALGSTAMKSNGGTFSDVTNTDNLTKAFAVCLAGLLTVAAQDLTLTVSTPNKEQSRIKWVFTRRYNSEYNEEYGSIKFGDLYSKEVRAVSVTFDLSDVDKEGVVDALKVSCSYKLSGVLYEPIPVIITVTRSSLVSSDQQKTLPEIEDDIACTGLLSSVNRYICENKISDIYKEMANFGQKIEGGSCELLRSELASLYSGNMLTQSAASSILCSHTRQRAAARGNVMDNFLSFATPSMLEFLEQAKKFDENPGIPLTLLEMDPE